MPTVSLVYNLPITLVFGGLVAHGAWAVHRLGVRRFGSTFGPLVGVWAAGLVLLYLRLVAHSIEVSGHAVWSLLMATHASRLRLPPAFVTLAWAVVVQVGVMKAFVLGGPSGPNGLAVGLVFVGATWWSTRDLAGVLDAGSDENLRTSPPP